MILVLMQLIKQEKRLLLIKKYVQDNLGNLVKDTDLSKFIL